MGRGGGSKRKKVSKKEKGRDRRTVERGRLRERERGSERERGRMGGQIRKSCRQRERWGGGGE